MLDDRLITSLHVELPPGIDLSAPDLGESTREALARAERSG